MMDLIPFSAKVEIDDLRHLIKRGLVAPDSKLKPAEHPNEYYRQCILADTNAFALVRNFLEAGFIPVITGLFGGESAKSFFLIKDQAQSEWYPKPELLAKELPGIKTFQIILDATNDILIKRLKNKGHDEEAIEFILNERNSFLKSINQRFVDLIIDTSKNTPHNLAKQIIDKLKIEQYF